jgi:hypothetical protein
MALVKVICFSQRLVVALPVRHSWTYFDLLSSCASQGILSPKSTLSLIFCYYSHLQERVSGGISRSKWFQTYQFRKKYDKDNEYRNIIWLFLLCSALYDLSTLAVTWVHSDCCFIYVLHVLPSQEPQAILARFERFINVTWTVGFWSGL